MKNTTFEKQLFEAIICLKNIDEAKMFFRDLCTLDEIKEMSDRWQTVLLLKQGFAYREIAKKLKISTTTVSRVSFWLNNGMGGYDIIFKRLNKNNPHHHSFSSGKELR